MKKPFLFRMPVELRAVLEEEAKSLGITLTALILQILGQYAREQRRRDDPGRYIDGYAWWQVGQKLCYTEKWVRDKGGKVLGDVAMMVFGVYERPAQIKLALIN